MNINEKYCILYTFAKENNLTTIDALNLAYCYWEPDVSTDLIGTFLKRQLPSDATPYSIQNVLTEKEKAINAIEFLIQLQGTQSLHDLLDWVAYQWQIPVNTGYKFDYSEEGTLIPNRQNINYLEPQELTEVVARLMETTKDLR